MLLRGLNLSGLWRELLRLFMVMRMAIKSFISLNLNNTQLQLQMKQFAVNYNENRENPERKIQSFASENEMNLTDL